MNQFAKFTQPISRTVSRAHSRISVIDMASIASTKPYAKQVKRKLFTTNKKADKSRPGSSMRQLALTDEKLLAEGCTEDELKEYHQVFSLFDTDDSGSIGAAELASAMLSMGLNPDQGELENLINEVDADGNGEIDFEEFCGVMKRMNKKNVDWDDIIKQCFTVFDRNGAGMITDLEFQYVLRTLGEITDDHVIEGIFTEFDVDGNGLIDYDEFSSMVKHYMTEEDVEAFNNVDS